MASESSSSNWFTSLPLPGILAVCSAVLGALLVNDEPLTPRRPSESGLGAMATINATKIDATPAEDPFLVINRTTLAEPPPGLAWEPASDVQLGTDVHLLGSLTKGAARSPSAFDAKTMRLITWPEDLKERVKKAASSGKQAVSRPHRHEVLVLPVLMRPFSDEASSEMRARQRQAVLTALYTCGYAPNLRKIECLRLPRWNSDGRQEPGRGPKLDVPFEWASPSEVRDPHADPKSTVTDTRYAAVLLLWINNDMIGSQAVMRLRELCHLILPRAAVWQGEKEPIESRILVRVIGPHSTEKLVVMVTDAPSDGVPTSPLGSWTGKDPGDLWPGRLHLFCQRATASALSVLQGGRVPLTAEQQADEQFCNQRLFQLLCGKDATTSTSYEGSDPPPFVRTITNDQIVQQALMAELDRRVPEKLPWAGDDKSRAHVAIISEFDSPYGRGLAEQYRSRCAASGAADRLHVFSYARGLDGTAHRPSSAGGKSDGDAKKQADRSQDSYKPDEVPMGASQSDALRRLAAQIQELHERLKKESGSRLVAVGLLGSDIYDKLLILRALRPRLKEVIFFSNNLDAWFWQRDELRVTRNLVVASAYGLALNETYQRGVPPFRDSYQTAEFAGALGALGAIKPGLFAAAARPEAVRLYEIGRDGPYDLSLERDRRVPDGIFTSLLRFGGVSSSTDSCENTAATRAYEAAAKLHPPRADHTAWWAHGTRKWLGWVLLLFPLAALVVLVMAFFNEFGANASRDELNAGTGVKRLCASLADSTPLWLASGLFLAVMVTHDFWRMHRIDGEPYAWTLGISVWPTETLRILVVVLGVHFLAKWIIKLRKDSREIESTFQLKDAAKSSISGRFSKIFWMAGGSQDIQEVWSEFKAHSQWSFRTLRSLPLAAVLFFIALMLESIFDSPAAVVRGAGVMEFDRWCDLHSHLVLIVMTAFVTDALWLNRSLIMRVGAASCTWPRDFLRNLAGRKLQSPKVLGPLLDLRFTAARTRHSGRLTLLPLYLIGLLLLARIASFDRWGWPTGLLLVYAGLVAIILWLSVLVRRDAEMMRSNALTALQKLADAGKVRDDKAVKEHREEILGLREGAFAPLSEQAPVRAMVWALGTAGIGTLLQYFSRFLS